MLRVFNRSLTTTQKHPYKSLNYRVLVFLDTRLLVRGALAGQFFGASRCRIDGQRLIEGHQRRFGHGALAHMNCAPVLASQIGGLPALNRQRLSQRRPGIMDAGLL